MFKYGKVLAGMALLVFVVGFSVLAQEKGSASDRAWVLDALKRYSPDGWFIVDTYTKKVPRGTDFMEYWDGPGDDKRWDALNTIAHEISHGYMREVSGGDGIYYYISPRQSILVPVGKLYITNKMVDSIPDELRTFRFSYVNSTDPHLGSQQEGAYGLMDEMNAYWIGTQTSADMLPLMEAKAANAPWEHYFSSVTGTLYGILEFRFFVLRYLLFAQQHESAVYQDILANTAFRQAFAALDKRACDFTSGWLKKKPALYERIRGMGLAIQEDGDLLMIGDGGSGTFMDIYELLRQEMAKPLYSALLSQLYDGKKPAMWPDSGSKAAPRGNFDPGDSLDSGDVASVGNDNLPPKANTVTEPAGKVVFSRQAQDRKGDGRLPFIDILKGKVTAYTDAAVFRLELAAVPEILSFNSQNLQQDFLEYEWCWDLDLDGDGNPDYQLSLSSYKDDGGLLRAPILERCKAEVWRVTGDESKRANVAMKASFEGATLTFTLNDSRELPLAALHDDSYYTARASYDNGKDRLSDSLDL